MMKILSVSTKKYPIFILATVLVTAAACFALIFFSARIKMPIFEHEVDSFASLCSLEKSGLRDGDTVVFSKAFKLEGSVTVNAAVNLRFDEKIDFCDYSVKVASDRDRTLSLSAGKGIEVSAAEVIYECPNCELEWTAEDAPNTYEFTKVSDIECINGERVAKKGLGGKGKARVTAVTLRKSDNPWLSEDIVCEIDGKEISATFPYLTSGYDLQNIRLSVETDGECSFIGCQNGDGSVNLTGMAVLSVTDGKDCYNYRLFARRDGLDIPVIYIDTENNAEIVSKDEYLNATFTLDMNGYEDFESMGLTDIQIEGRGSSSWEFDKKPYKIKFSEKTSVFGLAEATEYALFANYTDKSLMRNRLALEMAKELSFDYTPTQYPVDVFLNGEYIGVYTFGEHLETGEGRVEIFPELGVDDTDYFVEVGGVESGINFKGYDYFHAGLIKFALIESPLAEYMTDNQFRFIRDYFTKANEAVVNGGNYADYIDMGSLVDWIIMTELTNNSDSAFRRSCYFTKKAGEKLKMGPVWDHDLAFGNFIRDIDHYTSWATTTDDEYVGTTWSTYLFKDENFMRLFALRWFEVKDRLLARAKEVIETTSEDINRSEVYNFTVWDIMNERVKFERDDVVQYNTYKKQVLYLENFLENRSKWLDKMLSKYIKP